jgi:glucokinase
LKEETTVLLAGDIGGTKTRLAIFPSKADLRKPLLEEVFPSSYYPSLDALVRDFLSQNSFPTGLTLERASFGIAGPVIAGQAKTTNLPWVIDEKHLQESLNIPIVRLLNDLEAIAHFVPFLEPIDLHTLNAGEPHRNGTLAVIAPGTGLGEAFLTWDTDHYDAHPSEGGHTDFAPTNQLEMEMLHYLFTRNEHVSYEHVCSGLGLPNIYAYLKASGKAVEPAWLTEKLAVSMDPTPVIVESALNAKKELPCTICIQTLKMFVSILGSEAGNLALKVMATGGVYVAGGIPPRIIPFLEDDGFIQGFRNKGRLADILKSIPVHVVINPRLPLLGAAAYGFEL